MSKCQDYGENPSLSPRKLKDPDSMKCNVISIDLAKNVFQVAALDDDKQVIMNKQVKRC